MFLCHSGSDTDTVKKSLDQLRRELDALHVPRDRAFLDEKRLWNGEIALELTAELNSAIAGELTQCDGRCLDHGTLLPWHGLRCCLVTRRTPCCAVVVIVDENFLRSPWPLWELHQALERQPSPGCAAPLIEPVWMGVDPGAKLIKRFDSHWDAVQAASDYEQHESQVVFGVLQNGEQPNRETIAGWRQDMMTISRRSGLRVGGKHTQASASSSGHTTCKVSS